MARASIATPILSQSASLISVTTSTVFTRSHRYRCLVGIACSPCGHAHAPKYHKVSRKLASEKHKRKGADRAFVPCVTHSCERRQQSSTTHGDKKYQRRPGRQPGVVSTLNRTQSSHAT